MSVGSGNVCLEGLPPRDFLRMDLFGATRGIIMQRVKIIAGLARILWKEADALAKECHGFFDTAAVSDRVAQANVKPGVMWREFHHLAEIPLGGVSVILAVMVV